MKTLRSICVVLMLIALTPRHSFAQTIWGLTTNGGTNGTGVVYKTDGDGNNYSVIYNYGSETRQGSQPVGQLIVASDGMIYGVTSKGGAQNVGVLYQINPVTNTFTKKFDFAGIPGGSTNASCGRLVQIGTKIYGVTGGAGVNGLGSIFSYDISNGTGNTLAYSFTGFPKAGYPNNTAVTVNNKIYGTALGGANNKGALWEYDPATSTLTDKVEFTAIHSQMGFAGLVSTGYSNNIYFVGYDGNLNKFVLYEYAAGSTTLTSKYTFTGSGFNGNMAITSAGKLYGIIAGAGIYELDLVTNVFTQKHAFGTALDEGAGHMDLSFGATTDVLYGSTATGGLINRGIVFEYKILSNTFTKLSEGGDVSNPKAGVVYNPSNSSVYGTSVNEVYAQNYNVFSIQVAPPVNITKVFTFENSQASNHPTAEFTKSPDGFFTGVSPVGGLDNIGTISKFDLLDWGTTQDNSSSSSFVFANNLLGWNPEGGTNPFTTNSNSYGITSNGGANGNGVIYEVNSTGTVQKAALQYPHSLPGSHNGLVMANSSMYGLLAKWDPTAASDGVIFEFLPTAGTFTVKQSFSSATTGAKPMGKMTFVTTNGLLYGVASAGGANSAGTLFSYDPATNVLTKRHDFNPSTTGSTPLGNLLLAANGKLYGMTSAGGTNGIGTIYEFDPATNAVVKKHDFVAANGSSPNGTLTQSSNGKLYGSTVSGGSSNLGVLFEYDLSTSTFTKKVDFNGTNGANPSGGLWFDTAPVRKNQTVTFTPSSPLNKTYGDAPFTVSATTTSGFPITYSTSTPTLISLSATTGTTITVTILKPGNASIQASAPGDATWIAGGATLNIPIAKIPQTITWGNYPSPFCVTNSFTLSATASSGLPVTFSVAGYNATISGATATLNPSTYTGYINFGADQAGDEYYAPAYAPKQIIIDGRPTSTVALPPVACTGVPATFTAGQLGKTNYVWTPTNGGVVTGSGSTVQITWPDKLPSTQISVTYQDGTCTSIPYGRGVVVNGPAAFSITGSPFACTGHTKGYGVTAQTGASYSWSVSAGGSIMGGQGGTSIGVIWSTTGSKTVTLNMTVAGCTRSATYSVTAGGPPTGSVSTPDGTKLCPALQVRLVAPSGSSWLWSSGETTQTIWMTGTGSRTVTVTNSYGCTATFTSPTITKTVNCDFTRMAAPDDVDVVTGVADEDPLINGEVTVSPVPADKHLVIAFPNANENFATIRLVDVTGKVVAEDMLVNTNRKEIDVTRHSNGLYILFIETPVRRISRKVIIRH